MRAISKSDLQSLFRHGLLEALILDNPNIIPAVISVLKLF